MALRFRKSFKIAPGIRLNVSKSGLGVSAGVRGARVGINSRGTYTSVGIPGTGISSMSYSSHSKSGSRSAGVATGALTPLTRAIQTKTDMGGLGWIVIMAIVFFFINPVVAVVTLAGGFAWYQFSLKKKPGFIAKQKLTLAQAEYKKGEYEKAAGNFELAYAAFPQDKAIALHIASTYSQLHQYDKAAHFMEQYLEKYPADLDLQEQLARWYNELGQKDKALQLLQSLPVESTKDSDTLRLMANILEEKGLDEAAIEVLKRAPLTKRSLTTDLVEVIYDLGLLYEKTGDKRRAKSSFERVYAYDASFKEVATKITKPTP